MKGLKRRREEMEMDRRETYLAEGGGQEGRKGKAEEGKKRGSFCTRKEKEGKWEKEEEGKRGNRKPKKVR